MNELLLLSIKQTLYNEFTNKSKYTLKIIYSLIKYYRRVTKYE